MFVGMSQATPPEMLHNAMKRRNSAGMADGKPARPELSAIGLLVLMLPLLYAQQALADDTHYQDFLVGGRAMGLGGAFTSISNDPSGVFYNPAGIVDVHDESYQVSTSLYGFERGGLDSKTLLLPVPGAEDLNIRFTELIIIPVSAGYVRTFGERLEDGSARHAYALNVMVPSFRNFSINTPVGEDENRNGIITQQPTSYTRRVSDRELWSGLAYGYRATPRLSFGISGFYVLRSSSDIEKVSTSGVIDSLVDGKDDLHVFRTASNEISFVNGNLVFSAGLKWKPNKNLLLGVRLQAPSLRLHGQSTLRFTSGTSVPSCASVGRADDVSCAAVLPEVSESTFINRAIDGGSQTNYAPALRAGASWSEPLRYTVSADVAYYAPTSYELIRSSKLDSELRSRLPFTSKINRRSVLNVNLGAEYLIVPDVSVSAGFFTDFSSAAVISETPTVDAPPRVNLYGTTVALGYFGTHSLSRIGLLYSFGTGNDVIPSSDIGRLLETKQKFRKVRYFQSFFYIFVSSTFRY